MGGGGGEAGELLVEDDGKEINLRDIVAGDGWGHLDQIASIAEEAGPHPALHFVDGDVPEPGRPTLYFAIAGQTLFRAGVEVGDILPYEITVFHRNARHCETVRADIGDIGADEEAPDDEIAVQRL